MELKELANKLGLKNIVISHINHSYVRDEITLIVNDNLIINLVGKTYNNIPLNKNGIDKTIEKNKVLYILRKVKNELKGVTL